MTDAPRGPTTEELRARVLAQLRADERNARLVDAMEAHTHPLEGRTFYDPANPPLDREKGERLVSPTRDERPADYT